jgi:hypothetical protein
VPNCEIPRTAATGALALTAMLAMSACEPDRPTAPPPCGAVPCDVREESCHESLLAVIACFRGGDPELPRIDVISEEEYAQLVSALPDAGAMDEEKQARFAYGMSLLKLAPTEESLDGGVGDGDDDAGAVVGPDPERDAGSVDVSALVVARYFVEDRRIVVVDHGRPSDSPNALSILAHEMVHALQDEEHDLEGFFEESSGTLDESIARTAIVEGEATMYDVLTFAAMNGIPPGAIDWFSLYRGWQLDELAGAYLDDEPLRTALARYPFPFGGYYVTNEWLGGFGQRAVDDLFSSPLRSTLELLLLGPLEASEAAQAEMLREELVPVPPEGFELIAYDQLGALLIDVFLHRFELTTARNVDSDVLDIVGDGVSVFYEEQTATTVTVWRMRWLPDGAPTSRDLTKWRQALGAVDAASDGGLSDGGLEDADALAHVYVEADDLFVIISDQPLDPAWLSDLEWQSPPAGSVANAE